MGVGVQCSPRRCKYSLSFVLTEHSQILYLQVCLLTNIWKPEIHTCSASVVICRYTHAPHHRNRWELPSHAFPAQGEQGCTRPSGSSAHTRNERPLHGLFGAIWFASLYFLLLILQFKQAPPSTVLQCRLMFLSARRLQCALWR